mmetsp:Transcript_109556/g.194301  ORF Transcript_109556/g.194301 Transcript_109556/m.194301 type:complete len:331 (-) Transcript_109556:147-1139(-)
MHTVGLVLICMALAGQARRVRTEGQLPGSPREDHQDSHKASYPVRSLSKLLLAFNPAISALSKPTSFASRPRADARMQLMDGGGLKKVFIATPAYGGQVTVDYMTSVVNMVTQMMDVQWNLQLTAGESIITVGRNNMVMEFLESDCTHLLFLDADLSFEVETIREMLKANKDVCLVPYPTKHYNEQRMQERAARSNRPAKLSDGLHYVLHVKPDKMKEALQIKSRYVEIDAGPTGCMLIRRHVFDRMIEHYPELKCSINGAKAGNAYHYENWWRFFDTMVDDKGEFLGEDIAFCRRWRAIGGTVWADMFGKMGHVGRNSFAGGLYDYLLA